MMQRNLHFMLFSRDVTYIKSCVPTKLSSKFDINTEIDQRESIQWIRQYFIGKIPNSYESEDKSDLQYFLLVISIIISRLNDNLGSCVTCQLSRRQGNVSNAKENISTCFCFKLKTVFTLRNAYLKTLYKYTSYMHQVIHNICYNIGNEMVPWLCPS